jgi:hypothetical protein
MPTARRRFAAEDLEQLRRSSYLRVRAGQGTHRFTGIWVVVVEGRAFVRSWNVKPDGWYGTFLAEPHGAIRLGERELPVRAVRTRSERLLDAVDEAYLAKYTSRGSAPFARGLGDAERRATTTELVPEKRGRPARGPRARVRAGRPPVPAGGRPGTTPAAAP